jgi:REP element-mobilizing transposase RayT
MKENYYRGKLPHYQPPGGTYFLTYQLYGAIPKPVLNKIIEEYQSALQQLEKEQLSRGTKRQPDSIFRKKQIEEQKRQFKRIDDFLDSNLNAPHWLKIPEIAKLNAEALHFYDGKHYSLWSFCIMSNHIHVLLSLNEGSPKLWKVMQDLKKYTAKEGNKILGRDQKKFWERESYDHLVRDKKGEFERILAYILNNPVKAGLVDDWSKYQWSYCHPDLL